MSQDTVIIPYLLTYFLVKAKYGGVLDVTTRVSETLRYADATVPAYNGNVGERVYADATWTYHYDSHNRLIKAAYRSTGNVENFSTEYAYDRQANLTRLKKWGLYEPTTGDCALIDNLHISYDGNQAVRVEDYGEDPVFEGAGGFNAPDGVGTMTYDDNGNLTSDSGRGITRIEYNRFNLPTAIYFGDGHRQTIAYDGRGRKLSVTYSTATTPVLASGVARRYKTDFVRRYGAGRVVRGDSVEMVMHPYGYFDGEGRVRYYLHDFQGNVTMVVDNEGEVLQHTRYYPYGEAIDVFATSVLANTATTADRAQPYLYGGKELERMHGLGEYDYGARRLQSHLPLWTTQDPCLEKYYATSPYAYCAANPIRFTDPTGKDAIFSDKVSIWYIIRTLIALQNLTDDKLSVKNIDGKLYLSYQMQPLTTLAKKISGTNKEKGTSLLRQVIDHKKTLIIDCNNSRKETFDGKLLSENAFYTNEKNEQIVNFDFHKKTGTWTLNKNGDIREESRPNFIGFGHELIHGLRYLNGENSSREKHPHIFGIDGYSYKDNSYSDEEWSTVGIGPNPYKINENDLRRENGLNPRVSYGTPLTDYNEK